MQKSEELIDADVRALIAHPFAERQTELDLPALDGPFKTVTRLAAARAASKVGYALMRSARRTASSLCAKVHRSARFRDSARRI
jgi:hypothetical protein